MERIELESILEVKLKPIAETIERLEKAQEQIVTLLTNQARQDEKLTHMETDIKKCTDIHDDVYQRLRELEKDSGSKMWDVLKVAMIAMGSLFAGLIVAKLAGK